jgi:hypothetical protein
MKIFTGIIAFYFLVLAAANVYFVSMIQSVGALNTSVVNVILALERPIVWILNKVSFLYLGNMHAVSDITMRSSVIMLCTTILLVIGCVLLIRVED